MAFWLEKTVNRPPLTILVAAALVALLVTIFLAWCPPDACRVLNIQTYTISKLEEYQQFLIDEPAFLTRHHVRAVRVDCPTLRDAVVAALTSGRLTLGLGSPNQENRAPLNSIEAWHQGRLLHLSNRAAGSDREQEAWAVNSRTIIAQHAEQELFLSRLFGGLVLHVAHKQIPIVLFSDQPCI